MDLPADHPYRARFERVLWHIETHLDDELDVDTLSDIAAFSKFHFLRLFAAHVGIGAHRYVQLARLKRASYRLAFRPQDRVTDIAFDSGYEGPEAFSRAFKQRFGQTPTGFRSRPAWRQWSASYRPFTAIRTDIMKLNLSIDDVKIVNFPETPVGVLEHRGDPATIFDTASRFFEWRKSVGLSPKVSDTFQLLYDDPAVTPPEQFRCDLCSSRPLAANAYGVIAKTIPGGRCAVLRLVGSDDGFGDVARFLYRSWLPQSGEELRDFPLYCQRVLFFPDVPESEAITDIFLPLK